MPDRPPGRRAAAGPSAPRTAGGSFAGLGGEGAAPAAVRGRAGRRCGEGRGTAPAVRRSRQMPHSSSGGGAGRRRHARPAPACPPCCAARAAAPARRPACARSRPGGSRWPARATGSAAWCRAPSQRAHGLLLCGRLVGADQRRAEPLEPCRRARTSVGHGCRAGSAARSGSRVATAAEVRREVDVHAWAKRSSDPKRYLEMQSTDHRTAAAPWSGGEEAPNRGALGGPAATGSHRRRSTRAVPASAVPPMGTAKRNLRRQRRAWRR